MIQRTYKSNLKYPTRLLHGWDKLPPYYLGTCVAKGCNKMATFICYYHGDPKSISVKMGARYTTCKGSFCPQHAPAYESNNYRCCGKAKNYYVRCCDDCYVANDNRKMCGRACFFLIVWTAMLLPLIIVFGAIMAGIKSNVDESPYNFEKVDPDWMNN